jgi:hypothetical protein
MRVPPLLVALLPVVLVTAGCGPTKLNENKTYTLDSKVSAHTLIIPPPSKAMKVNVEFSSSDGDVTVLLVKSDDVKGEDGLLSLERAKALAWKRGKADNFTVDVPEKTGTQVIVREHTAAKTDVNLKVTTAP